MDPDEDVELVVQAAVVVLVEDLQPDEDVEDDGAHLGLRVGEEVRAGEVQDEGCRHLEEGLADDHLPHGEGDDGGGAGGGRAVEDLGGGRVGGEGERGERVPARWSASVCLWE